jgi:hypothetical protein
MKPICSSLLSSYTITGSFFFSGFFFLARIPSIAFLYTLFDTAFSGNSARDGNDGSTGSYTIGSGTGTGTGAAAAFFLVALSSAAAILALALAIVYFLLSSFLIFSAFSLFSFAFLTLSINSYFFFSSAST